MPHDILITNARLLPRPGEGSLLTDGFVAVAGDVIADTGPMERCPRPDGAKTLIDAGGMLVMPGLVNAHCHAAMTLFRGMADDLPLAAWLHDHIFPAEAGAVDPEMVHACARLAAAEMIMAGVTTVADGYFHEGEAARAFAGMGLRAVAAQGVIDFPAPGVPDPDKNVEYAVDFVRAVRAMRNSLVSPAIFCHSTYTCGPDTLRRAKEAARALGCLFFVHVAETRDEVEECRRVNGAGPITYLHDLGLLDPGTVCVHCVWADDADISLLAASGARVVTCPESNMKLASGTAPVEKMLAAGIPVALGSDGPASNNDLDLFGEMGSLALLHKTVASDAAVLPAGRALSMATKGGATVLGLSQAGRIAPGAAADLIIIDLRQPHFTPFYNEDILVYAASGRDVHTTIIAGRLLMRHRRLLSCEPGSLMEDVERLKARL